MFKRLNTGGEALSPQQIRNCSIRLLAPRFIEFIKALSSDDSFKTCTEGLTPERRLTAFDEELVLRFYAFKNNRSGFKHGIDDFLTEYLEAVSDPDGKSDFAYDREQEIFLKTFAILARSLGDVAFAFPNRARKGFNSGFSVYHFEGLTLGLQPYIDKIDPADDQVMAKLKAILEGIKLDEAFIKITQGGGKNSPGPLKDRIEFVEQRLGREQWT
jgi:hypothetical protein